MGQTGKIFKFVITGLLVFVSSTHAVWLDGSYLDKERYLPDRATIATGLTILDIYMYDQRADDPHSA